MAAKKRVRDDGKQRPRDLATAVRESRAASIARSAKPDVLAALGMATVYVRVATKIGDLFVAYGRDGVDGVRLADTDASFVAWHEKRFGVKPIKDPKPPSDVIERLRRGLAGDRSARTAIDMSGVTEFQRLVLEKTIEIARGQVRTYAWIAQSIGRPRAALAVRTTLTNDPVPLLVPCHRVVASDKEIGEYVFGVATKRKLLKSEGIEL